MKKEFKVGDKVVISKKSKFYGDHYSNPTDVEGTIVKIKDNDDDFGIYNTLNIRVEWDNGMKNSYRIEDLELAKPNMDKGFKVGDKVLIDSNSEYYSVEFDSSNPMDVEGIITEIEGDGCSGLGIIVKWDNGKINGYNKVDLRLAEKKSYVYNEHNHFHSSLKPKVMINAIAITDPDQIKALCKAIPSIKEQVQEMYPELFEVHKAGNRYVDAGGNEFILVTRLGGVALVDLETGAQDRMIYVTNTKNITEDEMGMIFGNKEYVLA
jgi:hypothetical protein